LKYGIAIPNYGKFADRESILEISITAEELGFDSLWVSDHIVLPKEHNGFGNIFYEPLVTLSYIASQTKTIKLGTSVIVLPYRNPVVFAKSISTLDVLSGGRVIIGIGVGWLKEEFVALGMNFKERGKITDEYLEIIKELFTNETPDFNGHYHKFSGISFYPKPMQKPYPPIWVGGSSKNALKRAVKYGSGWHAVGSTPEEIKSRKDELKDLFKKYNKTESDFIVSVRKNLQITKRNIKDERELLIGDPVKVSDGIKAYENVGVNYIIFQILGSDFKVVIETMKLISQCN
jgi:probable F420-dependent oxidoreductase